LAGVNKTTNNPQVFGTNAWPEAGTLFVRERASGGTSNEWRTQLFLKFDLASLTGNVAQARLRVHQRNKLNSNTGAAYSSSLEVARVTAPWGTNAGSYPLFDATPITNAFLFGNNEDFGSASNAQGFYSGTPGVPGTNDLGFTPLQTALKHE
jgi:hypothetical protein